MSVLPGTGESPRENLEPEHWRYFSPGGEDSARGVSRAKVVGKAVRVVEGTGVVGQFTKYRPGDRKLLAEFLEEKLQTVRRETFF